MDIPKIPRIWKKQFFSKPSVFRVVMLWMFPTQGSPQMSSTPFKVTLAWPILAAHQVGFPASACEGMLSMLLSHCFWWGWLAHVESIDILILCTFRWKNVASCVTFVFCVCNQLALVQDSGPQSSIFKGPRGCGFMLDASTRQEGPKKAGDLGLWGTQIFSWDADRNVELKHCLLEMFDLFFFHQNNGFFQNLFWINFCSRPYSMGCKCILDSTHDVIGARSNERKVLGRKEFVSKSQESH